MSIDHNVTSTERNINNEIDAAEKHHSPGPWYWFNSNDLYFTNAKGEGDSVLFCTPEYDDSYYSELHCLPADRALIAAAPDLLEAAKAFLTYVEINDDRPVSLATNDAADALRVAIYKATETD